MKEENLSLKVTKDLYFTQLNWTYAFLGVLLIVNIVKIGFAFFKNAEADGFFDTSFIASHVYMFVIGILAIQFLVYFINIGVTRKDYFIGNTIASIALALTITLISSIIFLIEKFILKIFNVPYKVKHINDIELDGNIIGDVIQQMIITPYADPNENLLVASSLLFINLLFFYLLGWLIGVVFYHYGPFLGVISVLFVIVLKLLKDNLLRMTLDIPTIGWFANIPTIPDVMAISFILIIAGVVLYAIRVMTKRIPVKL